MIKLCKLLDLANLVIFIYYGNGLNKILKVILIENSNNCIFLGFQINEFYFINFDSGYVYISYYFSLIQLTITFLLLDLSKKEEGFIKEMRDQ